MAFRAADAPLGAFCMSRRGQALHVAGTVSADQWQGTRRVQFRVSDAAQAF
jgi:single-stranded-DNA-specific exonuclease